MFNTLINKSNFIPLIGLVLGIGYLGYIVIEYFLISKYRKHIKYVIHVNGIRGKSTITRLIDSGLREFNFKVMSKTTGTIPTIIDVFNNEIKIKRLGPANIREQIKMLRKAYKDKCDYLVLECNCVNKELQKISEENILKANITIISNIREDHIGEMGDNLDEIALALASTIPQNGILITSKHPYNDLYQKECEKKNTKQVIATQLEDDFDTFGDNISLVIEVCKSLGLDLDTFIRGMSKYKHDYGSLNAFKLNESVLINGLSINDVDSIKIVYDKLFNKFDLSNLVLLINNRDDRPSRTKSLLKTLSFIKTSKIILCGSNIKFCERKIKEFNKEIEITRLKQISDLEKEKMIFAIGNIANDGIKILEHYKKGEKYG